MCTHIQQANTHVQKNIMEGYIPNDNLYPEWDPEWFSVFSFCSFIFSNFSYNTRLACKLKKTKMFAKSFSSFLSDQCKSWHSPTGVVNGNQSFVFSGAYFWKTPGQLSHPSYFREKDETRNPKGTGEDSLGRFLPCTESLLGQDTCTCMSSDGTFLSHGGAEFSRELRLSVTQTVIQQRMASVSWGFVYWKEVQ